MQELGKYKATTTLPFNAFGTMAMAREVIHITFAMYTPLAVFGLFFIGIKQQLHPSFKVIHEDLFSGNKHAQIKILFLMYFLSHS